MKKRSLCHDCGFTLIEMMVAVLCFALAGGMIFLILNSGMILYAKNMSVNTAHQDTRRAVNRLLRDIHASVSVPQLIDGFNADGSLQVHTSNITGAAGVAFQLVALGPTYIWKDPTAANLIMIYDGGVKPISGQRLIVPLWGIETEITKTTAAGTSGHSNVFLMDAAGNIVDQTNTAGKAPQGQGKSSNTKNGNNDVYAICYYTDRIAYLVQNGQLRLYYRRYVNANSSGTNGTWQWLNPTNFDSTGTVVTGDTNGITIARDITSATPFSAVWSNTAGVAGVNMTTGGSNYPNSTTVTISGGGGSGATGTAIIAGKVITGVNITNAGSGYTSIPSVSFSGGSGSGAAGTVSLTNSPTTDDRYVHVQITATDPTFNNRNYKATSSLADADMPYRSRLCSVQ
jgi:prepilin-type N-terminal cleavage/methylation domain-containing protein